MASNAPIAVLTVLVVMVWSAALGMRQLVLMAREAEHSVVGSQDCPVHEQGGRLVAGPSVGRVELTPAGSPVGLPRFDSAVFVTERASLRGPVLNAWPHHLVGECPVHGVLSVRVAEGRVGCTECGRYYSVRRAP